MAKILLVDDSKLMLKKMVQNFALTGEHEIQMAHNGEEALELFKSNRSTIEIIVTDLNMPVMDGFELISKLRAEDPDIPIIVCSANIQDRTLSKVKELGANDMFAKPDINDCEKIKTLLSKYV